MESDREDLISDFLLLYDLVTEKEEKPSWQLRLPTIILLHG